MWPFVLFIASLLLGYSTTLTAAQQQGLQATASSLDQLRHTFAFAYLEAASHMALANYHHNQGNRLLAFYILESARRYLFVQQQFDTAHSSATDGLSLSYTFYGQSLRRLDGIERCRI